MRQKDILAVMAALRMPYAATATVAYPDDFMAKVQRAGATRGTRFLRLLAPCPPAWQIPPARTIEYARLAVAARVFPLVEIVEGRHWRVTVDPPAAPLENYLEGQGRFSGLAGDARRVAALRAAVEERWAGITSKPQACCAGGRR
jgi:pyruvate/2-oxoacid:ferredoxin oxidoreductase beta subunit